MRHHLVVVGLALLLSGCAIGIAGSVGGGQSRAETSPAEVAR